MSAFLHPEDAIPNLTHALGRAPLELGELPATDAVGIAVNASTALPGGTPRGDASTVGRLAHLLAERSRSGSGIAIVPGRVAAEFAVSYPRVGAEYWSAPGGPIDYIPDDAAVPSGPSGTRRAVDSRTAALEDRFRTAFAAARQYAGEIPLTWESLLAGVRWAPVDYEFTYGGVRHRLQGALVKAPAYQLVCEMGSEGEERPPNLVSWIVSWTETRRCVRRVSLRHPYEGVRFSGDQIRLLFGGA